ncbi:ABC-three component system protein [Shewanella septentrionalis]|uniref:ABC-three component systems C-terminal domain-containing protein n=1 Tax=Shewanella septentrionalis TaxID=2952223 RepID=A0A9X2WY07_9GAMM|nr:ABC-three component system protein [Shewanella septentrionalis]MCT7947172.1 hypothetical protein [Shewanella septentrionalis]
MGNSTNLTLIERVNNDYEMIESRMKENNSLLSIHENQISNINTNGGNFTVGHYYAPNPTKIELLIKAARAFADDSEEYRDLLDELDNYQKPRLGREIIGLEKKLERAKMTPLLEDAIYLKSNAIKKIARYQLQSHKAAVHNYIYGKINEIFNSQIAPKIRAGQNYNEIDQFISTMIIQPLADEVCAADPTINSDTIRGMLYILTGNCHLTWK